MIVLLRRDGRGWMVVGGEERAGRGKWTAEWGGWGSVTNWGGYWFLVLKSTKSKRR